jgi:hypothetical protein
MTTADPLRLERFAEFEALESGWLDGYGLPIHPVPIALAKELLGLLDTAGIPGPGVFPTEEGGVSLEWIDAESFLGLEMLSTGIVELFALTVDSEDATSGEATDLAEVVAFVMRHLPSLTPSLRPA